MAAKNDEALMGQMLASQRSEISEYHIYSTLASLEKSPKNRKILERIAADEREHYGFWKRHTGKDVEPSKFTVFWYTLVARIFGITFAIKLMESGEKGAQAKYGAMTHAVPGAKAIKTDEEGHEKLLVGLIDEDRLRYVSSMVLGLNDALVELSGALAGLTFALQNSHLIGIAGLITGIAAAMSMASSEYLSTKTEEAGKGVGFRKDPVKAAGYTGAIYLVTVLFLVLPYFLLSNLYLSLALMLCIVLVIIYLFTFYISVVQETPFLRGFLRTAAVSLGIAAISFGIGLAVRAVWGIQL